MKPLMPRVPRVVAKGDSVGMGCAQSIERGLKDEERLIDGLVTNSSPPSGETMAESIGVLGRRNTDPNGADRFSRHAATRPCDTGQ